VSGLGVGEAFEDMPDRSVAGSGVNEKASNGACTEARGSVVGKRWGGNNEQRGDPVCGRGVVAASAGEDGLVCEWKDLERGCACGG